MEWDPHGLEPGDKDINAEEEALTGLTSLTISKFTSL